MIVTTGVLTDNVSKESIPSNIDTKNDLSVELVFEDMDCRLNQFELHNLKELLYTFGAVANSIGHINPRSLSNNASQLLETGEYDNDRTIIALYSALSSNISNDDDICNYLLKNYSSKELFLESLALDTRKLCIDICGYLLRNGQQIDLPVMDNIQSFRYFRDSEFMYGYTLDGKSNHLNIIMQKNKFPCIRSQEQSPFNKAL